MTSAGVLEAAVRWTDLLWTQSLRASAVFAVVLVMSRLLGRRGPAVHLALWSLVFVRLLLPPDLTHPWSVGALAGRFHRPSSALGANGAGVAGSDAAAPGFLLGSGGERPIADHESPALAAIWLIGCIVALVVRARKAAPFQAVARTAAPATEPAILLVEERWRRRLRVRRRVRVVTSSARVPPFTVGVVRPLIFVPRSILADSRSLEAAMAHEMAHVARWDALWLSLQHLVHAVYFFHPLVWIAGARIELERERLCDATVVSAGRLSARSYVGGLLDALRLDVPGAGAPTMSARKRRIGMRIQDILARDGAPRPRLATAGFVACLVGAVVLPLAPSGAQAELDIGVVSSPGMPGEDSDGTLASFANPLPGGRVTWRWGPGRDPWTGDEVFHRGIDLAAAAGTPVLAPADGIVSTATEQFEPSPGSGTVIAIDHGEGWVTFYSHLGSLGVTEGQRVTQGDAIATVGSTGRSTGPHLHFEVRRYDEALDPADFVNDWRR